LSRAGEADRAEGLRLQEVLRGRHADLEGSTDDGERLDAVLAATEALLDFEDEVPVRRAARWRRVSSLAVYAVGGAAVAGMLAVLVLLLAGRLSWWFLIPALLVAGVLLLLMSSEPQAPVQGHGLRLTGVLLAAAGAVVTGVVAAGLLSPPWLISVVIALVAATMCRIGAAALEVSR
jgi:hypothetical protein